MANQSSASPEIPKETPLPEITERHIAFLDTHMAGCVCVCCEDNRNVLVAVSPSGSHVLVDKACDVVVNRRHLQSLVDQLDGTDSLPAEDVDTLKSVLTRWLGEGKP